MPKKTTSKTILYLCVVVLAATAWAEDGWQSLFDGQTLNGWKASENQGGFKVVDGAIAFDGARSLLFYVGEIQQANPDSAQ